MYLKVKMQLIDILKKAYIKNCKKTDKVDPKIPKIADKRYTMEVKSKLPEVAGEMIARQIGQKSMLFLF